MKRLKIAALIAGIWFLFKSRILLVIGIQFGADMLQMHLGAWQGITIETIMLSVAIGLFLWYVVSKMAVKK